MTTTRAHAVGSDVKLCQSQDTQPGIRWPLAVGQILDLLVAAAEEAGERTSRKELLAALVATQKHDGAALGRALKRYRKMSVGDALGVEAGGQAVVQLVRHGPGPRDRQAG